ncbi:MAG: ATP-binding cassette domain-containing protein [Clostridia bacterium]|nr:ATP-binding cassette domain-containing protein [Clostridia bacterium]
MKQKTSRPHFREFNPIRELVTKDTGLEKPYILSYNLSFDNKEVFGAVALCEDKLYIREGNSELKIIELSTLGEIKFVQQWGCISLETSNENGELELCRADMRFVNFFRAAARKFEAARLKKDIPDPVIPRCPKCGKPYPPGRTTCQKCTDKRKLFGRLIPYMKPNLKYLLLAALFLIAVSGISVVLPILNKAVINDYIAASPAPSDQSGFFLLIGGMAALGLLSAVAVMARRLLVARAAKDILIRLQSDVYRKIQELSLTGLNRRSSGELIQRVANDTEELREFITWLVPNLIQQALTLGTVAVLLLIMNWKLTILVILPVPFLVLMFRVLHKFTHKMYHRQWQVESDAGTLMHDVFSGMRVVKTYGTEKREEKRFDEAAKKIAQISKKNELTWNMIMPFASFLLSIGEYAVLYFLGRELVGDPSVITSGNANFALGDLMQFVSYVGLIYEPIRWMSFLPRRIARATTSLSKIVELLDEKNEMCLEGEILDDINGDIEFKNASFGYADAEYVLKNINLKIGKGEMVGFVGRSGVGKTTAANLVLRLYDLSEGSLTVDGKEIKTIDQHSYRSKIGVVLQETFLFNGTIYSNIAYAKPGATRDEVIRAAKLANAHEFIMRQPDGYNTYVGDKGHTLSGGERQRIAIARAILRNPRILILDEATSSLDTETEKQIQEAIALLSGGRTTIAIAHRLSTLRNATKIVVFEKGMIEEEGSHDELMRNQGRYYRLVMAQRQVNKMQK